VTRRRENRWIQAEAATSATYVYGVLPGNADGRLAGATGVGGTPVRLVRDSGLAAIVSDVSLDEFGEAALRRNLENLDWLGHTARSHQAVLDRAMGSGPLVPLRLCTVFAGDDGVRAMLARDREALGAGLDRVRGREEWGVKLIAEQEIEANAAGSTPSGREYLAAKGRRRREQDERWSVAADAAAEIHERLAERAAAATLLPPQSRELSSRGGEMVLNGAYLVDAPRVDEFRATAAQLAERRRPLGLQLELTGPWPPYNFVGV
jgi:hypothetical protein